MVEAFRAANAYLCDLHVSCSQTLSTLAASVRADMPLMAVKMMLSDDQGITTITLLRRTERAMRAHADALQAVRRELVARQIAATGTAHAETVQAEPLGGQWND